MNDHPDTDLTEPHGEAEALRKENARLREELMAGRAQPDWKAMAERLGDAARTLDDHYERHICYHDSVHRGGSIWTICDDCGAKWADDRGGFKPFEHPEDVVKARAALSDLAKMNGE